MLAWVGRLAATKPPQASWTDRPSELGEAHWQDLRSGALFFAVRDAALVYRAALERPAGGFRVVNLSNDTAYAQVSTDAARRLLGFACIDPQPYLDFYARQNWEQVYGELERRGLPAVVLGEIRAARQH